MQWKAANRPTFTWICKSANNWVRLWQRFFWDTDGLLMTDYLHPGKTTTGQYYTEPTFKLLDVNKRNSDKSCHLGVWLFHDNAPAHKSLVAQQAVCNCEFVQLNHPAYSLDWALSNLFPNEKSEVQVSWNLVYRRRITADRCQGMVWESTQKILFSRHKQLKTKVENKPRCCRRICQKMTASVI